MNWVPPTVNVKVPDRHIDSRPNQASVPAVFSCVAGIVLMAGDGVVIPETAMLREATVEVKAVAVMLTVKVVDSAVFAGLAPLGMLKFNVPLVKLTVGLG